ncbi:hypothetical protein EOD42_11225 [Rhodovarius crocodyli]|uniref:Uncharacterized protein n=1 Tax=Rhodovarius crocodyli TaxID=1979269 RepID=A0A437MHN7_9PROT|nr:hypothetical protein EOD42_11225 [Rhodovarius crocodyli]
MRCRRRCWPRVPPPCRSARPPARRRPRPAHPSRGCRRPQPPARRRPPHPRRRPWCRPPRSAPGGSPRWCPG